MTCYCLHFIQTDVMNDVDDVEETTAMLEERIGSLEEEHLLLLLRLSALEDVVTNLENITNIRVTDLESDVQGIVI